jgi:hypothetical protein
MEFVNFGKQKQAVSIVILAKAKNAVRNANMVNVIAFKCNYDLSNASQVTYYMSNVKLIPLMTFNKITFLYSGNQLQLSG